MSSSSSSKQPMKFPSRSNIYCSGRLVSGPDNKLFYVTQVGIIGVQVVYLATVCPPLFKYMSVSPYVVSTYLMVVGMIFFYFVAFMDPGIIPRGPPLPEEQNPFTFEAKHPMVKKIMIGEREFESKWCDTCNIYRPLRATHCSVCNNCVYSFDHHCPYIGNCVGRRNYKPFLLFLFSTTANGLFMIATCIVQIVLDTRHNQSLSDPHAFSDALDNTHYFSLIIPVYTIAGLAGIGGLGGLHCYLVATGQSTNESIKNVFKNKVNPWSRGFFGNCYVTFFPPVYPSFSSKINQYPTTYEERLLIENPKVSEKGKPLLNGVGHNEPSSSSSSKPNGNVFIDPPEIAVPSGQTMGFSYGMYLPQPPSQEYGYKSPTKSKSEISQTRSPPIDIIQKENNNHVDKDTPHSNNNLNSSATLVSNQKTGGGSSAESLLPVIITTKFSDNTNAVDNNKLNGTQV